MPKLTKPSKTAARGRPRSEEARRAILDATRVLVEKSGYRAATIEAIAARAGVAKTTIYRWWPNRSALMVELLVGMATVAVPLPGGGEPLRALRTELRGISAAMNGLMGRLLVSILGEAQDDPETRETLLKGLFVPRHQATSGILRRAQASGALLRGVTPEDLTDMIVGPLFFRLFVHHAPVNEKFAFQVYEHVLAGLRPKRPKRARRK